MKQYHFIFTLGAVLSMISLKGFSAEYSPRFLEGCQAFKEGGHLLPVDRDKPESEAYRETLLPESGGIQHAISCDAKNSSESLIAIRERRLEVDSDPSWELACSYFDSDHPDATRPRATIGYEAYLHGQAEIDKAFDSCFEKIKPKRVSLFCTFPSGKITMSFDNEKVTLVDGNVVVHGDRFDLTSNEVTTIFDLDHDWSGCSSTGYLNIDTRLLNNSTKEGTAEYNGRGNVGCAGGTINLKCVSR